jgi:hypothetical protein
LIFSNYSHSHGKIKTNANLSATTHECGTISAFFDMRQLFLIGTKGTIVNPYVVSAIISKILGRKRICPACNRGQVVSSEEKDKPVKCKFCGSTIPAQVSK